MTALSVRADRAPVGTPPRAPRSLRRTTSHTVTRPDGLDGPMAVTGLGRDLHTDAGGAVVTVRDARIDARASFEDGRIGALATDQEGFDPTPLVGGTAFSGFRLAARSLLDPDHPARSLLYQLLDDLPIALLLSGRVPRAEGIALGRPGRALPVDVCAGWVAGGSLVRGYDASGPPLHLGPPAPALSRTDDPLGWHDASGPPPRSSERRRRLDLELGPPGEPVQVRSWFRDTFVDRDGLETVVHEYAVHAEVGPGDRRFRRVVAAPGPLPYVECPGAAASAERLVDVPLAGVRDHVSASFTGPSTCTHLNDALRALEEVDDLLDVLLDLDGLDAPGARHPQGSTDDGRRSPPEEEPA